MKKFYLGSLFFLMVVFIVSCSSKHKGSEGGATTEVSYPTVAKSKNGVAHLNQDKTVRYSGYDIDLTNVKKIVSTDEAFAALKNDGTVVIWGGGLSYQDFKKVEDKLNNIVDIFSYDRHFFAIKSDDTIISVEGGQALVYVKDQANNNLKIYTYGGERFLVLKADGSIMSWYERNYGNPGDWISYHSIKASLVDVVDIYECGYALIALKSDGTVVSWGDSDDGGDSSSVKNQLNNVVNIFINGAIAALKSDGSVVTWGRDYYGGDSSSVKSKLNNIVNIFTTHGAFAALKSDKTLVVWGNDRDGGDASLVQDKLNNVVNVFATHGAFAALKSDKTVVVWGDGFYGGDASSVKDELNNVVKIITTNKAFALLRSDGSVINWGNEYGEGSSSAVSSSLSSGVVDIFKIIADEGEGYASECFVALKSDGTLVYWASKHLYGTISGNSSYTIKKFKIQSQDFVVLYTNGTLIAGGESEDINKLKSYNLTDVKDIASHGGAGFMILKSDGTALHFGKFFYETQYEGDVQVNCICYSEYESNTNMVKPLLNNIKEIYHNDFSFSMLKNDGSVVNLGIKEAGGTNFIRFSSVSSKLNNVKAVYSTDYAFAALKEDGTVVTWGDDLYGGDTSLVNSQLNNVVEIYSSASEFIALRSDGSIVKWGSSVVYTDSAEYYDKEYLDNNVINDVAKIHLEGKYFIIVRKNGSIMNEKYLKSIGKDPNSIR